MRPPLTYWGGKQMLLSHILPLIPSHQAYVEPFAGGAAVFFAKTPAKVNILNDTHAEVVNFYQVLKSPRLRRRLMAKLEATPYSRKLYLRAIDIFFSPQDRTKIERAWALFTACGQAFNARLTPSWSVSSTISRAGAWQRKINLTQSKEMGTLLSQAQIDNRDACDVIRMAKPDSFIYADPPYVGANQGHYSGYDYTHFEALLKALEKTEAKFMLSSYPSELLQLYSERNQWITKKIICPHNSSPRRINGKRTQKTEVLTMNYTPPTKKKKS